MITEVLSETVQRFNGASYYRCGQYYQRKGVRLHRAVWEYHNGEIPKGYHVHHKDGNRANNSIENLELMKGESHLSLHMSTEERKEKSREFIKQASEYARKWHGSSDGVAWHSEHAKETWSDKPNYTRVCDWCGREYQTRDLGHKSSQHFCCGKHRSLATQWRYKHEGSTNYPNRQTGCVQHGSERDT